MRKLEAPRGLKINFAPSERQYLVWKALQGGVCDICGAPLEMKLTGYDEQGHSIHEAVCSRCGNTDIPELVLAGGSARRGQISLRLRLGHLQLFKISRNKNGFSPQRAKKFISYNLGNYVRNPSGLGA